MVNGTSTERADSSFSTATKISSQAARCRLPSFTSPGTVHINLRFAHVLNDAASAAFTTFLDVLGADDDGLESSDIFQITSLHPYGGPSSGGTAVTLTGRGLFDGGGKDRNGNLLHGLYCHFDPPANELSSREFARSTLAEHQSADELVANLYVPC